MAVEMLQEFPRHPYDGKYADDPTYCNYQLANREGCPFAEAHPVHIGGKNKVENRIIVERRQLIAEINLGNGDEPAVKIAYEAACQYVAEHVGPNDPVVEVEFTFMVIRNTVKAEVVE